MRSFSSSRSGSAGRLRRDRGSIATAAAGVAGVATRRPASGQRASHRLALVFTVEKREAVRERLLRLAEEDERSVAGAAVGSLAVDGGDRFSDLDLTFAIADDVSVADVLADWTRTLVAELDAVHLADLERGPTIYRVFLLPDALQFDLSMTPAAHFRPAGPRFRLLFGKTADGQKAPEPPARARPLRVGRHLRAPRACVHRAGACLAGRALRRRRPRPCALACLPPGRCARGTGARLRRPLR